MSWVRIPPHTLASGELANATVKYSKVSSKTQTAIP